MLFAHFKHMARKTKVEEEEVYHVGKTPSRIQAAPLLEGSFPEVITKARVSEEGEWASGSF